MKDGSRFELDTCGRFQSITLNNISQKFTGEDEKTREHYIKICSDYIRKKSQDATYNIRREPNKKQLEKDFIDIIKKSQEWNPRNPPENLVVINGLKERLKKSLGKFIENPEEQEIRYYSSSSTDFRALDDLGIDCFFTIGNEIEIRIDVKSSEGAKEASSKKGITDADIELAEPDVIGIFKNDDERTAAVNQEAIKQWSEQLEGILEFKIKELKKNMIEKEEMEKTKSLDKTPEELRAMRLERMRKSSMSGESNVFIPKPNKFTKSIDKRSFR